MQIIGYLLLAAVGLGLVKALGGTSAGAAASPTTGTESGTGAILFDSTQPNTGPDVANGHTPATMVSPGHPWCPFPTILWKDTHTGQYICVMPPSAQIQQSTFDTNAKLQTPNVPVGTVYTPPVLVSATPIGLSPQPSSYDPQDGLVFPPTIAAAAAPSTGVPDLAELPADRTGAATLFGSALGVSNEQPANTPPPDIPAAFPFSF